MKTVIERKLFSYCAVYGVDVEQARQMYCEQLAKGFNALQTQRDKYKNVLRKVVEKMNKIKEIEV